MCFFHIFYLFIYLERRPPIPVGLDLVSPCELPHTVTESGLGRLMGGPRVGDRGGGAGSPMVSPCQQAWMEQG